MLEDPMRSWIGGAVLLLVVFAFFGWPIVGALLEHREKCRQQRHKEQLELARARGSKTEE